MGSSLFRRVLVLTAITTMMVCGTCTSQDDDTADDDLGDDDVSDDDGNDDDSSDDNGADDDGADDDTSDDDDSDPAIRVVPESVILNVGPYDGAADDVFVYNDGGSVLSVTTVEPQLPFEIVGLVSPTYVLPGSSYLFAVQFMPTELGVFQDEVVLNTNDPLNPQITIPCIGVHNE